jgi:2-polyprenyl-3-methyl-5-hydroxy-6-metoxy-1,4-benzoquinol methylase
MSREWSSLGEPFDIVFCRNVMIYFDAPTQRKVLERIHGVLRPAGCCTWAIPRTSPTRATCSAARQDHLRARLTAPVTRQAQPAL